MSETIMGFCDRCGRDRLFRCLSEDEYECTVCDRKCFTLPEPRTDRSYVPKKKKQRKS